MATNHTTNYQLCQWEATDKVLRTDFNQDNQKIDAALAAHDGELAALADCMVFGEYTGDGTADRAINLGFKPRVLILSGSWGYADYTFAILTLFFGPYVHTLRHDTASAGSTHATLTETGFQLPSGSYHNMAGYAQRYMAIR